MVSPLLKHCFKSGVSNSNVFKGHIVKNGALTTTKTKKITLLLNGLQGIRDQLGFQSPTFARSKH